MKLVVNQVIKFEELFEEMRRSGATVQDEVRMAIVLKRMRGLLKTQWGLFLECSAKQNSMRDQIFCWDRSQQKWSGLVDSWM